MAEGRMIYVGPSDDMPRIAGREYCNSRRYIVPKMGEVHYYGERDRKPIISKGDPRYGLMVLRDLIEEEADPLSEATPQGTIMRMVRGTERARDLAQKLEKWGCLFIDTNEPTGEQIQQCAERRKQSVIEFCEQEASNYRQAQMGQKGFAAVMNNMVRRRFKEAGVQPPDILATFKKDDAPQAEAEQPLLVQCPKCAEPIRAAAVKCRYCGSSFSKAVIDLVTEPAKAASPAA